MSNTNESTTIQDGLAEIGDAVDNAVSDNAQENTQPTDNTEETVQQAVDAKATLADPKASKVEKKAAQKMLKKLILKIDGEEIEENLPFEIPDDPKSIEWMKRELQMGRMGQKRAQEKATIEREVMQFIEDLRKNPKKALSDPAIGMDLKKFAAEIIEEEIENSKKSPEQLEKEKLQAELKAMKEEREKEKADSETKELERLREQEYERLDLQMSQALEKHKFPKTPGIVKRMADYLLVGLEAKKDITPEDIVPLIREDIKNDYKEILNSMPDDDSLEEFIGKEFVDRIRRKNIAKAKKASSNPAVKAANKTPSTGQKTETEKPVEKKTIKQLFGV